MQTNEQQQEKTKENKDISGTGVALGLFIWGLILLGFPKFTNAIAAIAWALYAIGLILVLIGVMGMCIEWGKRQSKRVDTYREF